MITDDHGAILSGNVGGIISQGLSIMVTQFNNTKRIFEVDDLYSLNHQYSNQLRGNVSSLLHY
jgi:hypothetical protein